MPIRFQVDPDFYDHPKAIGMSDAATALWVRAGSYSAAKTSDGFVADGALALLSQTPMEAARELCRRGLWKRVRGGYRFHQWESRNLTRARVEADKEADRLRKRRERANGKPQVEPPIVRPDSTPDSGRNPTGVRPLSVSVSVSESVSGSGRPAEPPLRCPKHLGDPEPPPCGGCADARRAHERWERNNATRLAAAPRCPRHRGQLAHNCSGCLSERKGAA
jgi:hypothetical protein